MDKFFNNGDSWTYNGFYNSYKKSREESEKIARYNTNKAIAYYYKSRQEIEYYLRQYMAKIIQQPNALDIIRPVIDNFVPKTIKNLCMVYRDAPEVEFLLESDKTNYDTYIKNSLNIWRKEFHRLAKLVNTILIKPIWDDKTKTFDFLILHQGNCEVEYNEAKPKELYKVSYLIEYEEKDYAIVWTETEHYAIDIETRSKVLLPDMDGSNPYGVIPFVVLRLENCNDFWGDGLIDLVNMNEAINAALSDAFNKRYLSFGVAVGVNTKIRTEDFFISPNSLVQIETDAGTNQTGDFKFATPDHQLALDLDFIQRNKEQAFISLGLPRDSYSNQSGAQSGYAKTIEALELLNLNNDDKAVLRLMEYDLFNMFKIIMQNDSRTIKFKGELVNVDFAENSFPKSSAEIWTDRDKRYQYGMETPADWLKEDNPDLTDKQVEEILMNNQKLKSTIIEPKAKSPLEIMLNQNNQTQGIQ